MTIKITTTLATLVIIGLVATLISLPKTPYPKCSLGGGLNQMTETERLAECGW